MWGRYDMPEILDPPAMRQLRARCMKCFHDQTVGTPFRHREDSIELDEQRTTTYAHWAWLQLKDRTLRLFCADCETYTWQAPKGSVEVEA